MVELESGATVGSFRVTRLLGRGGMGAVYLARDQLLGRRVALKLVARAEASDRFLDEAQLTARVTHPNVITVYQVGEHEGSPYLALELVEGQTLRERMRQERFTVLEALRWMSQVAAGVAAAHAEGVLHLDLKPQNVLLGSDGRLRVADFGLAQLASDGQAQRSGTPGYMAPEVWKDAEPASASDIWAMGVMLHELLHGRRPYQDVEHTRSLLATAVADSRAVAVGDCPDAPGGTVELVSSCLCKAPAGRPSALQVHATLEGLLARASMPTNQVNTPFPGLRTLRESDASALLGRDAEIDRVIARLQGDASLVLTGPSGAGKSSLVFAGVLPRLRESGRWLVVALRPGPDPVASLLASIEPHLGDSTWSGSGDALTTLSSLTLSVQSTGEQPAPVDPNRPSEAGEWALHLALLALARQQACRVLLVVDQLEEVVTLCEDPGQASLFSAMLACTADDPDEPVRALYTVREDYLAEALGHFASPPPLAIVQPPSAGELEADLARVPERVGFRWEDAGLPGRLVAESSGSLPLLQFGLARLWELRDRDRHLLTVASHEALGGIAGALARHADEVVEAQRGQRRRLVRHLLLQLTHADGTRRPRSRPALLAGLPPVAAEVLEDLVTARLVVAQGTGDQAVMELAHESLAQSWRRLRDWLDAQRGELRVAREVEQAAEQWARRGRPDDGLWSGTDLDEGSRLLQQRSPLPSVSRAFLQASITARARREQRKVRLRQLGALGALGVTLAALAVAWTVEQARQRADAAAAAATREASQAQAALAQGALEAGRFAEARARARTALELADTPAARAAWWRLENTDLQLRYPIPAGDGRFLDGNTLLAGGYDGTMLSLDLTSGIRDEGARHIQDNGMSTVAEMARAGDGQVAVIGLGGVFTRPDWHTPSSKREGFDGQMLAVGSFGDRLEALCWEMVEGRFSGVTTLYRWERDGPLEEQRISQTFSGLAPGPGGRTALHARTDHTLWLREGEEIVPLGGLEGVAFSNVTLSSDASSWVAFGPECVRIDVESNEVQQRWDCATELGASFGLEHDGSVVIVRPDLTATQQAPSREPAVARLPELPERVWLLDEQTLVAVSKEEVFGVRLGASLRHADPHARADSSTAVAISGDGGRIATIDHQRLVVRDRLGVRQATIELPAGQHLVSTLVFSADGGQVSFATHAALGTLDIATGDVSYQAVTETPLDLTRWGDVLLVLAARQVSVVDAWSPSPKSTQVVPLEVPVMPTALGPPDEHAVPVALESGNVRQLNLHDGSLKFLFGTRGTPIFDLAREGTTLHGMTEVGLLYSFDPVSGANAASAGWSGGSGVAFADGLVVADRMGLLTVDAAHRPQRRLMGTSTPIADLASQQALGTVAVDVYGVVRGVRPDGRSLWSAPYLGEDGASLTHRGWEGPEPGWRAEAFEGAIAVEVHGGLTCVERRDGGQSYRDGIAGLSYPPGTLVATDAGCAHLADELLTPAGGVTVEGVEAAFGAESGVWTLAEHTLTGRAADGTVTSERAVPTGLTAVSADGAVIGLQSGEWYRWVDGHYQRAGEARSKAPVRAMLDGPGEVMVLATEAPELELWSDGRLATLATPGVPERLHFAGPVLTALTHTGERVRFDFSVMVAPDCALMDEVVAGQPHRWRDGALELSERGPARCSGDPTR